MKYMIHTCPSRKWYVDEFLVPSMLKQGIQNGDITVYNDVNGDGHLMAFMKSCKSLTGDGTWHLQDDVIISQDFRRFTGMYDDGVVCGFVNSYSKYAGDIGYVPVDKMWYSMPCIRIPDELMRDFVNWFNQKEQHIRYKVHIFNRKHSDVIFWDFLKEVHPEMKVLNLAPNLVNHVDHLIGGSLINEGRDKGPEEIMSLYWEETALITELEEELKWRNEK